MKKAMALRCMNWKKGQICTQMIPLLKRGETNQRLGLKTTLVNTCWAIEEHQCMQNRGYPWIIRYG